MTAELHDRIAGIYADGWSRIVATMIRLTGGDWDLAEECAQDAFTQALQKWPGSGVPDQPLAWLTTTARHRAIDRMRRASAEAAKLREVAAMEPVPPYASDSEIPDERLDCPPQGSMHTHLLTRNALKVFRDTPWPRFALFCDSLSFAMVYCSFCSIQDCQASL